ncbi:MAG: hypothetical protein ACRERU_15320 [Methylococcales bacterium]
MLEEEAKKITRDLARLAEVAEVSGMDVPGFKLYPLKGRLKGFWAVGVSGNLESVPKRIGSTVNRTGRTSPCIRT